MKKVLLTLGCNVMLSCALFSQTEKKVKEQMWDEAPAEFKITKVPEKWKNESAVLIAVLREHSWETAKAGYHETFNSHYRIKLQDKAAVQEFSEMSFNNNTVKTNLFGKALRYRILGIKVIKANGTEKEIDLKDAVKEDAGSNKELKIPIPNLEPGDIIDYFAALKDDNSSSVSDEELLEMKYPVIKQTLRFNLYDKLELTYKSFNGAPEFQRSFGDGCVVYTLEDNMREKSPDLLWDYDYRTAPNFRYRIKSRQVSPDAKTLAVNTLNDISRFPGIDIGVVVDYMKGNFKGETDQKKITYELYNLLRNPLYLKAYFGIQQGNPLRLDNLPMEFFLVMSQCLDKYKISHDLMLAPSRGYGPFANLVNLSSCDIVIRVNTTPKIYITRPTPFSIANETAYQYEGTTAAVKYTIDNLDTVGTSSMEQNVTNMQIKVSLDDADKTKINVQRNIVAKGHTKEYHQGLVVTNYDYLKAYDLPKYQVERSRLMGGIIKDYNKEKDKYEQRLTTDYNDRDKRIKDEIESEMDVKISNFKLNLKSIGMWETQPTTEYSENFTIENLTKKAGPNTIIELGKVIEKQLEIKDDQLKRTRDIYMAYPRTFSNDIVFAIPDGYTVEGVENFNIKSENGSGAFVSTAKIDGKNLVIHTTKYYINNFYPASDWNKITAFTKSAQGFYNAKILLKKN
ncbi:DUF3857 domain-containing protein [Pinibacter aurantiacus]|uniref:DUF3857 domain-containing protein n=1 Tax=Pinibacter aurantiacus TaxID=2851599 RepID=A0A9E2SDM8_9BACT|nr:DUF3857 domain-containing protein [Pinibacter aurantiacus]MBV4359428.1 DUF3857 domain-containing protein [Pinibacter aurantiacus]